MSLFKNLFGDKKPRGHDDGRGHRRVRGVAHSAIARPEDLFEDPHLAASGGLMSSTLPNGVHARLPKLPVTLKDVTFAIRRDPPAVGQDTLAVLTELGYDETAIEELIREGTVASSEVESSLRA